MENLDYRVGFNIDPSTVTGLQSLIGELQKMQDLLKNINSSGVGFGTGGGGGFGGGSGGGGGGRGRGRGGNSASGPAATASGMGGAIDNGSIDDYWDSMLGPDPFAPIAAPRGGVSGGTRPQREDDPDGWRNWAKVTGFNALAYGVEDMYYAGFRGALNNVGFLAQGIGSQFLSKEAAMGLAGVGALTATAGAIMYDNRESIFGEAALGARENSIFGLPTRTEAGRFEKMASDAMAQVDKYGAGSRLGQSYMSDAAMAIRKARDASVVDMSAEEIAAMLRSPGAADIGRAERLSSLSAPMGDLTRQYETDLWNQNRDSYLARAAEDAKSKAGLFTGITAEQQLNTAKGYAGSEAASYTGLLQAALSGNPDVLRSLESQMEQAKLSEDKRATIRNASALANNISGADNRLIEQLRSGARNPFADVDYRQRELRGMLSELGADDRVADDISNAIGNDMREQQRNAPMPWEEVYGANQKRWVGNIAASFGSIELNGRNANARGMQTRSMKSEIYNSLLAAGVPREEAARRADLLYREGYEQYQQMVNANQGNPAGFMASLSEEQQMAFSQYQQNYAQIQMQYQAWRQYGRFQRSRMAFRGAR